MKKNLELGTWGHFKIVTSEQCFYFIFYKVNLTQGRVVLIGLTQK